MIQKIKFQHHLSIRDKSCILFFEFLVTVVLARLFLYLVIMHFADSHDAIDKHSFVAHVYFLILSVTYRVRAKVVWE
jgi:hypothetical protein